MAPGLFLSFFSYELMTEDTSSGVLREIFEEGATKVETWEEIRRCWSRSGEEEILVVRTSSLNIYICLEGEKYSDY